MRIKSFFSVLLSACLLVSCAPQATPLLPASSPPPPAPPPTDTPVPTPTQVYLADLQLFHVMVGYWSLGIETYPESGGELPTGELLRSYGVTYPHGLFAHAYSWLAYRLDRKYQTLSTTILMDEASTGCSDGAGFYIFVDGYPAFTLKSLLPGEQPLAVEVDLSGAEEVILAADPGPQNNDACDWAIWGDPTLTTLATADDDPASARLIPENADLTRWLDDYAHARGGSIGGQDAAAVIQNMETDPSAFLQSRSIDGRQYTFLLVEDIPLAVKPEGEPWQKMTLRFLADAVGLRMGSLLSDPYSGNLAMIDNVVVHEFNHAIGTFQSLATQDESGDFTFENSDRVTDLALAYGLSMEGDDLVYGLENFRWGWAKDLANASREELIQGMNHRITGMMTHFAGRVAQWCVVNEPLEAEWRSTSDRFAYLIGEDYVDIALRTARQADPTARLMAINSPWNETRSGERYQLTWEIVQRLKQEDLIDAVGLQMSLDGANPPAKDELILTMQSYGVPVIVSSMEVNMQNVPGTDQERFEIQAGIYRSVLEACLESGVCTDLSFWGIGDAYHWKVYQQGIVNADATIFDDDLRPKPAYYAITQILYDHIP